MLLNGRLSFEASGCLLTVQFPALRFCRAPAAASSVLQFWLSVKIDRYSLTTSGWYKSSKPKCTETEKKIITVLHFPSRERITQMLNYPQSTGITKWQYQVIYKAMCCIYRCWLKMEEINGFLVGPFKKFWSWKRWGTLMESRSDPGRMVHRMHGSAGLFSIQKE